MAPMKYSELIPYPNTKPNLHSTEAVFDYIHHNSSSLTDLDLSCQRVSSEVFSLIDFQSIASRIHSMSSLKRINLSGHKLSQHNFENIISSIIKNPIIKELHVSKSLLTELQQKQLMELTGINELKGFRITTSEGINVGSVHTNWETYAQAKKEAYLAGMRTSTRNALEEFKKEHNRLPAFILDFGAGTGQDTISLAVENCPKIWAVDGDENSLKILQSDFQEVQRIEPSISEILCIHAPFIHVNVPEPVELLVSSYTWPYRRPPDFPACWKKCIDIVKLGGYISGHFFGPITGEAPDPGLTYHTEEQLRDLLSVHFEIRWFRKDPENSSFKVFGGNRPAWGDLYHVVAKKVR